MDWLARTFRKFRFLAGRETFNRELEEEMTFHRAQAEKELIADGMSPEEAHFAAQRQFGNDARLRDHSQRITSLWFETSMQDMRFAIRQLRKNPGFAVTAIVILTLGIAASIAIFSFVDAALIKPLPYKNPSRLAILFETTRLGPRFHLSYPDYLDWKRDNTVFESLDVFDPNGFIMRSPAGPQDVDGSSVSAGFFRTLGVTPILGRDFHPDEDQPAAPRSALISYAAWQRRFGGRNDVIGQSVNLDGNPTTIIGVLPRDFHFAPAEPVDFWASERSTGGCEKRRSCHNLFGIARLKPGVTFAAAFADIKTIAQNLERQYPESNRDQHAFMMFLTDFIVGDIRPILLVLLSGAALLLLIAAVNVSSLLLVRSERRKREIAVRGALGASRARLIRQFITEGVVLALSAGVLGTALAYVIMQLFLRLIPTDMLASMPYLHQIGLTFRVLVFAALITLAAGVLFSLLPAVRISLSDLREGLSENSRSSSGTVWRHFGANLVVTELTLAVVLLVGAGLLGKSFYRLLHVDTGLQIDHLAIMQIAASGDSYKSDQQLINLERELQARLSTLPGVKSVALTGHLPLGDGDGTTELRIIGRAYHGENNEVAIRKVSANYFSTLQARLVRGRYFADDEDESRPKVAIINQQLARQYFAGQNPLGMQVSLGTDDPKPMQVIGVINDIQEGQLDAAPRAAIYPPFNQDPPSYFGLVMRTSQREDSLLSSAEDVIHRIGPALAVSYAVTMKQRVHDSPSASLHRSSAWLVGGFAALALLLSVVGLYGVIAYSVSQRTREIGVRIALGAPRSSVYRLILGEAGRLAIAGIGAGLLCSLAATMLIRKLLFDVQVWDVTILASVGLVLAAAGLLASYFPARRAASINPTEALHTE
ncbi:MAG TPA: ABC transporter permease [Silvibacterium sp.]|nr:ABC transporter permease [Silvibacterium sp.]